MASLVVSGYQEANETLRMPDLRQALYDEGAILMEKVLVNPLWRNVRGLVILV